MIEIRRAKLEDQEAIREIYNESVRNSTATFDTEEHSSIKQLEWFKNHKENHPVFVAVENDEIVGWASLSPWSDRCAYDTTVEVSVYIDSDHRGKKIGSKLLEVITAEGKKCGNHTIISRITEGNEASIHIHTKYGYEHVGVLKQVGFKFGRFLDVYMMQKLF